MTSSDAKSIPYSLRLPPHETLKRDFGTIIPKLNELGFSNVKLGHLCDVDEKTIRNWARNESEPVYSKAIVLIAMHDIYCTTVAGSDKCPSKVQQAEPQ